MNRMGASLFIRRDDVKGNLVYTDTTNQLYIKNRSRQSVSLNSYSIEMTEEHFGW